ncbi:hypothetical protein, partial [Clostridioides difficile]|uniref:hypothetical protein n=1 Tax=Clostridioides difficile TaxID=1496 RepID=UPI001CA49C9E
QLVIDDNKDWDLNYLEYMWVSVLKRPSETFFNTTPKKLFSQIEAHKKYNGIKDENDIDIVDSTEFM